MSVVWAGAPMTATEVFASLKEGHGWKQKTVNTFLTRLVEKGVLAVDRSEKAFAYTPRMSRDECVQAESDSFLGRVFHGAAGALVLHFCEHTDLKPEEIRELEQLLKSRKGRK
jgi:BlaI family penicillinase repressor